MSEVRKGDWDKDFTDDGETKTEGQTEYRKAQYVQTPLSGTYKLRLVGDHVYCRKQFKPYKATCQDDEKSINPAWKAGWFPGKRFAINVINKTALDDNGNPIKYDVSAGKEE